MKLFTLFTLISFCFNSYARTELKGEDKKAVINILEINESLHKNFFDYKASLVEEDAKRLSQAISIIKNTKITDLLKDGQMELAKIKKGNEREANNIAYHKVSLSLIKLLEEYNPGKRYNAYSCPMVKKRWVQNSEAKLRVHNPYAPEMPHCGQRDTEYGE